MGIFDELKAMGVSDVDKIEIFSQDSEEADKELAESNSKSKKLDSLLFDRKSKCPACGKTIFNRAVKTRRARLMKTDLDLRPIYQIIDPMKYDVLLCKYCGYATPSKLFKVYSEEQIKRIKKEISTHYKGKDYPEEYSYLIAIERYKLALYNAIVAEERNCFKAYICLKITWLYRSLYEEYSENEEEQSKIDEAKAAEKLFMEKTIAGFEKAVMNSELPFLELDERTVQFLIGELYRRLGKEKAALKWISTILGSTSVNPRLKERARQTREEIKKAKEEKASDN